MREKQWMAGVSPTRLSSIQGPRAPIIPGMINQPHFAFDRARRSWHWAPKRNAKKPSPLGGIRTTLESGRQPVAKPEWGRKVSCTSCGNKFYDMKREPAVCPSCGTENDPLQAFRPKRGAAPKPAAKAEAKPKEVKAAVEDDEEDLDAVLPDVDDDDVDVDDADDSIEDDEDDDLMEDTADLGEDDDDLDEVREHIEPGDDVKE